MPLHPSTTRARTEKLNMAISDEDRRDLFNRLEDKLGTKPANTFMELLPHQPADELVTRTDIHAFGTGLRGEMAELRGELTTEMAELRTHLERLVVGGMVANAIAVVTALVA